MKRAHYGEWEGSPMRPPKEPRPPGLDDQRPPQHWVAPSYSDAPPYDYFNAGAPSSGPGGWNGYRPPSAPGWDGYRGPPTLPGWDDYRGPPSSQGWGDYRPTPTASGWDDYRPSAPPPVSNSASPMSKQKPDSAVDFTDDYDVFYGRGKCKQFSLNKFTMEIWNIMDTPQVKKLQSVKHSQLKEKEKII